MHDEVVQMPDNAQNNKRPPPLLPPPVSPVGHSAIIQSLSDALEKIASYDVQVLLIGESGTGREALARYIHSQSSRRSFRFISVAAASLSAPGANFLRGKESTEASEAGMYAQAEGGSLFVARLEDLGDSAQQQLLTDIKSREYLPEGGIRPRSLDVRLLGSAEPTLSFSPSSLTARSALLGYFGHMTLQVPALRAYKDDIPDLVRHYVDQLAEEAGFPFRRFSVPALNKLREYSWPGNLEELQNFVRRLLILGERAEIDLIEIEQELGGRDRGGVHVTADLLKLPLREAREHFERAYLEEQLLICNGKVQQLADRVGMDLKSAYARLNDLGLAIPLRDMREEFERAYLKKQLELCEGKIEKLAKRVGMERTHLYRKLEALNVRTRRKSRKRA